MNKPIPISFDDFTNILRIDRILSSYPLTLEDCVNFLEIIAPLTDVTCAEGIGRFLKDIVNIRCSGYAPHLLRGIYSIKGDLYNGQ